MESNGLRVESGTSGVRVSVFAPPLALPAPHPGHGGLLRTSQQIRGTKIMTSHIFHLIVGASRFVCCAKIKTMKFSTIAVIAASYGASVEAFATSPLKVGFGVQVSLQIDFQSRSVIRRLDECAVFDSGRMVPLLGGAISVTACSLAVYFNVAP